MKVIVVGLGSMRKRRIRLMRQFDSTIQIIGVDSNKERAENVAAEHNIQWALSIDDALNNGEVTCAFVCTSPLSHHAIIKDLLSRNLHVFTEINLVSDGYESIMETANRKKRVLFLSSTFLYRKDIQYIIEQSKSQKVNYMYHTGQYLPDWHPWENYKNFFVGNERTNGCREILAIELPWIIKCFGKIKGIKVLKDKITSLDIDYPDNYMILIEHEGGTKGQIAVDIVARKAIRRLEVFNEKLHIFWDGTPQSLFQLNIEDKELINIKTYDVVHKDNRYSENIIENAYMDEIAAFFDEVEHGNTEHKYHSFEKDLELIALIDQIER